MEDQRNSEPHNEKRTILLIEDDESHTELIRRVFEDNSSLWDIHHVTSINDAQKWFEENKIPALVISDYLLPDGTALDLTKGTLFIEETDFPLIVITGVGSEQLAVHALKSGIMDYVVKSSEEFRELPWRAARAIREWDYISKRKQVIGDLPIYVRELERAAQGLEEFTHLIEDYADKLDDVGHGYLIGLRQETERMTALTEELRTLSQEGRRFHESEDVDINELLEEIERDLSTRVDEYGGELLTGKLPTITTQRVWMKELLVTLIENGLRCDNGGRPRVEVRCEERAEDYLFTVSYNGDDSKELRRIFSASEGLSPYDYEGSNLRLNMCKMIIDKFCGKIWLESKPGETTAFCFLIPRDNGTITQ